MNVLGIGQVQKSMKSCFKGWVELVGVGGLRSCPNDTKTNEIATLGTYEVGVCLVERET
jgi:hypothetical protein